MPNLRDAFGVTNLQQMPGAFLLSIETASDIIRNSLRRNTPMRTGTMYLLCRKIGSGVGPNSAFVRVGWTRGDFAARGLYFYPPAVGEGTGIYNRHKPIRVKLGVGRPKTGVNKYIRYEYRGGWVSLREVRGQPAQKIVQKAILESKPAILRLCSDTGSRIMTGRYIG